MKLHQEISSNTLLITHYEKQSISVNREVQHANFILTPQQIVPWQATRFAELSAEDIRAVAILQPELLILSTGSSQRFPSPALLRPLIEARIGWEVMDVGSACRTYNILAAEGRKVAAAFLLNE